MKYIFLTTILFILTSCSTNKAVQFDTSKLADRTIYFHMTYESHFVEIEKTGASIGESDNPNNIEVFEKSLHQLSQTHNLKLGYSELSEVDSVYLVTAELKKAVWHFGFSNATMTTEIEYSLPDNRKFTIEGESKVFGVGTKTYHLLGSFVNANSKFLQEISK